MSDDEAAAPRTTVSHSDSADALAARDRALDELAQANDQLMAKNHALAAALTRASKELTKAKSQIGQFAQPPLSFATMVEVESCSTDEFGVQHASVEVVSGARRLIVPVATTLNASRLNPGDTVLLNENMVVVRRRDADRLGTVLQVKQVFADGRVLVADAGGASQVVRQAGASLGTAVQAGDRVLVDPAGRFVLDVLPPEEQADLVLEETPEVTFADIGGLDGQIERIRDAVEMPFLHRRLYHRYHLSAPKGILLYGPPGNGKTMIAKAVAHALAEGSGVASGVFLSVKGPELLNKYVGESERLIRLIFRRARERAADGRPVIVFIDEMDSLLRTRGSGVSSDMETTIVPQFLSELVDRPGEAQACQIVRHYLTDDLPFEPGVDVSALVAVLVHDLYAHGEHRHVADILDDSGVWSPLYLGDVASGAMLKNIVDRAKTMAVKASIDSGEDVALTVELLAAAVNDECRETRDAVLDADPVQWSRINGIAGGRVVRIRPAAGYVVDTDGITADRA